MSDEIQYETKTLTSKEAKEMLATNTKNRKVSRVRVKEYAQAMRRGEWQLNGQPILISASNVLLDGQHRLLALASIREDIKVPFVIGKNVSENAFETIDTGKKRSSADLLSICGVDAKHCNTLAAAGRILQTYLSNLEKINMTDVNLLKLQNRYLQNKDYYSLIHDEKYKELFYEGITLVLDHKESLPLSPSESLFIYVLLNTLNPEKAKDFCNQLFISRSEVVNSPVHHLLNRIKKGASSRTLLRRQERIACTLTAWNYYITDKIMKPSTLCTASLKSRVNKVIAIAN